jgi:alanine dehydrogenase
VTDEEYRTAGAEIASKREDVFSRAEMIIKVKEPQKDEIALLKEGQILYTYLHLAPDPEQTKGLLEKKVVGVAYETIQLPDNSLPLLTPMSEIAGRMSIQCGARSLEKESGGRGVLLGGVPGVEQGHVVIIGCGIVGRNAAKVALGMGADVTILDINLERLRYVDDLFGGRIKTLYNNRYALTEQLRGADLVVGAILIPGAKAAKLITRDMLKVMKEGSVLVDVAVDQGGCAETTKPTTHSNPTYVVDGVIHYCVANMPGAVARTSTYALTNATLPYALRIAEKGIAKAVAEDASLAKGVNVHRGTVTHPAVAESLGLPYTPLKSIAA